MCVCLALIFEREGPVCNVRISICAELLVLSYLCFWTMSPVACTTTLSFPFMPVYDPKDSSHPEVNDNDRLTEGIESVSVTTDRFNERETSSERKENSSHCSSLSLLLVLPVHSFFSSLTILIGRSTFSRANDDGKKREERNACLAQLLL